MKHKFGFIKRVDKGGITTVSSASESKTDETILNCSVARHF